MCGRIVIRALKGLIAERVKRGGPPGLIPNFNIAPTGLLVAVRAEGTEWTAALRRWGLIPHWAEDTSLALKTFNARAETVAEKPTFRSAFRKSRCLIPVDGFYEWRRDGKTKTPFFIRNTDPDQMLVFAGLEAHWPGRNEAPPLDSCSVITTTPNALMEPIHTRMPVVLPPEAWDAWLDPSAPATALQDLLVPCSPQLLEAYRVGPAVGNVRNNDPSLLEPLLTT